MHLDGLVQECSISIANQQAILQSCTKPLIYTSEDRETHCCFALNKPDSLYIIVGWNHQLHDCFLNRLFRRRKNKTLKLRVTGLRAGSSPDTDGTGHKWPVTRKMFPFDDVTMYNTESHGTMKEKSTRPSVIRICNHSPPFRQVSMYDKHVKKLLKVKLPALYHKYSISVVS